MLIMLNALIESRMNHVLNQLEQLVISVENHEITFIVFAVIILLLCGIITTLFCLIQDFHSLL